MSLTSIMATCVILLVLGDPPERRYDSDLDLLLRNSQWNLLSAKWDGQALPVEKLSLADVTLNYGEYAIIAFHKEAFNQFGEIYVDTDPLPRQIDAIPDRGDYANQSFRGIYQIAEDKCVACFGPPDGERPQAFESKPGDLRLLLHFELEPETPEQIRRASLRKLKAAIKADERFSHLHEAAYQSLVLGYKDDALRFATESLKLAPDCRFNLEHSVAIEKSNAVLGRLAIRRGDIAGAKQHLLASLDRPDVDEIPDMSLAKELLERGETEVVLDFLKRCRAKLKDEVILDQWMQAIRDGEKPRYGFWLRPIQNELPVSEIAEEDPLFEDALERQRQKKLERAAAAKK